MSIHTKSPLHPSTLSLNDIHPGRRVIKFNRNFGISLEGIVVSKPYVWKRYYRSTDSTSCNLAVDIRSLSTGEVSEEFLSDMGVVPYSWFGQSKEVNWNDVNFTIDARKRHLLPERVALVSTFDPFERERDEADSLFADAWYVSTV